MATLKFFLQSKANPANIYIRLSLDRKNVFRRKSGYTINPNDWSNKKSMPIARDAKLKNLDSDLDKLRVHINGQLNKALNSKTTINGNWLQTEIDTIHGLVLVEEEDFLVYQIQKYIDTAHRKKNAKGSVGLSENTLKGYTTFKNMILKYQKAVNKGNEFAVKNIDLAFSEKFIDWLFSKGYNKGYVGKNIDKLKTICRDAQKRGVDTSNQIELISGFSEQKESDEIITLSNEEQETIANLDLKREALINARKWLLLGCQLGQRYGDLMRVDNDKITTSNGIKIVEMAQGKGNKLVAIPLMPKAIEIIENRMPYKVSNQKLTKYFKEICKLAELDQPTPGRKFIKSEKNKTKPKTKTKGIYPKWQLIGTHVCRRSFATNFYGVIPTAILKTITRHSTEKMFLRYIGKTSYDNAHQMMEYFGKLQAKENKDPQMQVLKNSSSN